MVILVFKTPRSAGGYKGLLDLELPERLGQAIEEVLSCGAEVECWFHQGGVVEDYALKILQEEKSGAPTSALP